MSKFKVGDVVRCISPKSKYFGLVGTVIEAVQDMYRVYTENGSNIPFYDYELELAGSNSQPMVEEDPHTRITDDESDKNPFEHTDLGTDLSGDELMESIRSICGR